MKRKVIFISMILVTMLISNNMFAQESDQTEKGKFGIGFQSSFPVWGGSIMLNLNEQTSIQGLLGMFGDLKTYGGRFIYRFNNEQYSSTYGYGLLGAFSYTGLRIGEDWSLEETTETVFGFGAGVGIEYNWQALSQNLPALWSNI